MIIGTSPFGTAPLGGHPVGAGLTGLVLQIGPQDVTPFLQVDSYRLRRVLNGRDEFECTLLTTTGYVPLLGQPVILNIDGGLEFVGTVHERDIAFLSEGRNDYTQIQMRAVDLNEIADRHIVVDIYEDMTAGAIIRSIVTEYLAADLIKIGDVQEGPLVTRVVFPYMSAAACFDDLCEQSGFHWNIDQQRALSFFARTTAPAPFTITSANATFRGLQGRRTRNQYRNVQYVDGGHGVTDSRTESFRGDGVVQSFNVEYPVYAVPTITVNFAPQTVGIRGVDTGQQWFWNNGETAIGQAPGGTILLSTDSLRVSYQGLFDLIQVVEDLSAIQERIDVQGGSGRYEMLDRDDNLDGQQLVEEKGLSLLRRYASLDEVIDFETDVPGLAIGQLATVDVPELGLDDTFLITQLEVAPLLPTTRRFRVTATTGEIKGTYQELFKKLLTSAQPITIREGEILQEVSALHDLVGVTDSIVESTLADFSVGAFTTIPSTAVLDTFTRANESPLNPTNWGIRSWSGHKIVSNQAVPVNSGTEWPESAWKTAFGLNQEVYVTLATAPTVAYAPMSLLYRCQSPTTWDDYYRLQAFPVPAANDQLTLAKVIGGVATDIGPAIVIGREWANGDKICARVSGDMHVLYLNGVVIGSRLDADILTGNYIGLGNDANAGTIGFTNFGGGTLVTAPEQVGTAEFGG